MNCYERKEYKRKSESQKNWETKAMSRRYELEKAKSRIKELIKSRDMWKEKCEIAQNELNSMSPSKTKIQDQIINENQIQYVMISFCNFSISKVKHYFCFISVCYTLSKNSLLGAWG